MKIKYIFLILLFLFLAFFHFRGLSIHDGGYILHSAQRMLDGEMIYKDFDFVYTPGSVLLVSSIFKIFGPSIFVERAFALFISLLTIYVLFKLLKLLNTKYWILNTAILFYIAWGPTHINFISPVMLSITTGICTIYYLLKTLNKKNKKYLLYAGLTTGLSFLFKQNFGLMLFITGITFFLVNPAFRKRQFIYQYLVGLFIPFFFFLLFLILSGSFNGYLQNLWFYTIENIIIKQQLTTPFFYGSNIVQKLIKAIFYLIPVWISMISGLLIWKEKRKYLFICIWVISFYLVSIRPETDFVHLVPILSITGILLVLLPITLRVIRLGIYIFSVFMIVLGFWTGLFMGYYRWEKPLAENTYWNNYKNVKIWTDSRWTQFINELNQTLNKFSIKKDYLFINANTPLLYFLSNRKNPTQYDFIIPYALTPNIQKEIILNLMNKEVKLVITEETDQYETPVSQYIRQQYIPIKSIDKFILWKKKPKLKEF